MSMAEHPATVALRDRLVSSQYDWNAHLYRFRGELPAERVAACSSFEGDPSFSPDGRRLAFTSGRSGRIAIWESASDGSGPRQLTADTFEWQGSPNWSPRGDVIAFDASASRATRARVRHSMRSIWSAAATSSLDGSSTLPPDASHVNLAVSPDGTTILFRGLVR